MAGSKKAISNMALIPMLPHETLYVGVDVGLLKSPSLCQIQHLSPPARGFDGHLP